MSRRLPKSHEFTRIELLVVVAMALLIGAAFAPRVIRCRAAANIFVDKKNLEAIYEMHVELAQRKAVLLPARGGHAFVLAPWVYGVCERTEANRDRFFTPGRDRADPRYRMLAARSPQDIWRSFDELDSRDTHYAGRSGEHYDTMWSRDEVMMADDGEFFPAFCDGSVNVLMGDGRATTLRWAADLNDLVGDDEGRCVEVGESSPAAFLRKLVE